jgi:hypothetical protein
LFYLRGRINVLRGQMCVAETVEKASMPCEKPYGRHRILLHFAGSMQSLGSHFPAALTDSRIHTSRVESRELTFTVYYVVWLRRVSRIISGNVHIAQNSYLPRSLENSLWRRILSGVVSGFERFLLLAAFTVLSLHPGHVESLKFNLASFFDSNSLSWVYCLHARVMPPDKKASYHAKKASYHAQAWWIRQTKRLDQTESTFAVALVSFAM